LDKYYKIADSDKNDTSVAIVPSQLHEEISILEYSVLRITRRNRNHYVYPTLDENLDPEQIGISKSIRKNLRSALKLPVQVQPVVLEKLQSVSIAPVSDTLEPIPQDKLLSDFIKPFFDNNFRPVYEGFSFSITVDKKSKDFKVISITLAQSNSYFDAFSGQLDSKNEEKNSSDVSYDYTAGIVDFSTNIKLVGEIDSDENLDFIGYADVGGQDKAIRKIREALEFPIKHPKLFQRLGITPPSGVLMYGPPGTGKTLLARAVSNECGAFFFLINGPEIVGKMQGESESNLRKAFEIATENAPAIIFIDEIDSIAPKRADQQAEGEKRIVATLLTLLDGVKKRRNVMVLAATNRPNAIDPALRRFGRFDREIEIGVPNEEERFEILQIHSSKMRLAEDFDLAEVAKKTHGMVGADLAQVCTEAAYNCVKEFMRMEDLEKAELDEERLDKMFINQTHFEQALGKVDPSTLRETAVRSPNVKWSDIGGMENVKQELKEIVEYPLLYPEVFSAYGQAGGKGCLLWGPPGCGKTLLAKAIASECQANFISVKGPELLTMWVGKSESNVRDLFSKARGASPCVIFIDELDSIAQKRGSNTGDSGVSDRVMNSILIEMDGLVERKQVFVIGATNRPDILDPALTRPGRLDTMIYVGLPDKESRKKIFEVSMRDSPVDSGVNLDELVEKTKGYSSADITGLARNAAKIAIRTAMDTFKREKALISKTDSEKKDDGKKIKLFTEGYPPITMKSLLHSIQVTQPSVSVEEQQKYLQMLSQYSSGVELTEEEKEKVDILNKVKEIAKEEKNK